MTGKRTLCDWDKKQIEKNIKKIIPLVNDPKYICRKCARVANSENYLCKPVNLKISKK